MILIFIFDLLSLSLFNYLAHNFLTLRYNHNIKYIIFILTYFSICLQNINGINSNKALFVLIIYTFYIFIQYTGRLLTHCFVLIPFFTFQIFSEILVGFILSNVFNFSIPSNILTYSHLLGLIISFIMLCVFTVSYIKISKYIKFNNLPKYSWLIFIVPVITILLMIAEDQHLHVFKDYPRQYRIIIILCIVSYLLTIVIFIMIINTHKVETDLKIEKYKSEALDQKFSLMSQHYLYNFNFLHDLIHSYSDIYRLLNNKDLECAKIELNALMDKTYKEFNSIYSNSIVLNYLLNMRLNSFKSNHIECITTIEDEKINIIDFNTQFYFFNYILDISENQIQFIEKDEYKIIAIKSKMIANNLIIQCIIPYVNLNLEEFKNNLYSILSQYHCIIDISKEQKFKIKLIINFNKT